MTTTLKTNTLKTSRDHGGGSYFVTGYVNDSLVQYSLKKTAEGWKLERFYGECKDFPAVFSTKRAAIQAVNNVEA
jgi:hypothetical protein